MIFISFYRLLEHKDTGFLMKKTETTQRLRRADDIRDAQRRFTQIYAEFYF